MLKRGRLVLSRTSAYFAITNLILFHVPYIILSNMHFNNACPMFRKISIVVQLNVQAATAGKEK